MNTSPDDAVARSRPIGPPRVASSRRAARWLIRGWPFLAWCGSVAAAAWLWVGDSSQCHARACTRMQELRIAPAIDGRIESLRVTTGQTVAAGELLATLDARDVEARLQVARAELARACARIEAEREELRLADADRRAQAAARHGAWESDGRRLRGIAEGLATQQATDQAELAVLAPQLERLTSLVERKLATADRVEELVQRRAVLEERIASRAGEIPRAHEELVAWGALEPEGSSGVDLTASLLPYELARQSEAARVGELEVEREQCRLLAPAAGIVHAIAARPGEWRAAGEEIARIGLPSGGRVEAWISESQVAAIAIGTGATLQARDVAGPLMAGRVELLSPLVEEIPPRLREQVDRIEWGRRVTIATDGLGDALAGSIFHVRFR